MKYCLKTTGSPLSTFLTTDRLILSLITIYLQSECIEKYQFELCSKYDKERDFDLILRSVVPCRKLRWVCRKHSNDVARQDEIPGKSTIFVTWQIYLVVRQIFHVSSQVTLHHNCKTFRYCRRRIFSLTTCKVLCQPVKYCVNL